MNSSGNGVGKVPGDWSDVYQEAGHRSDFFRDTRQGTVRSISGFMLLLTGLVVMASLTFGWTWIPIAFVALLAMSGVLLVRSRALGRGAAYYEESVHFTTATLGILAVVVLIVAALN